MPSTIKVRVHSARNLPPMQGPLNLTTNAFVIISIGGHSSFISDYEENEINPSFKPSSLFQSSSGNNNNNGTISSSKTKHYRNKTKIIRKSLNPLWEEEFRFDVSDDTLLQEEPLIFKVQDAADSLSENAIGSVYVDLNPLLMRSVVDMGSDNDLKGFFPIYDPLEGVRGELEVSIKVNFIGDTNPFRDSSAGVQLFPFSSFDVNSGYSIRHLFGFCEELVVAADPEFDLTGVFRIERTSHEKRQVMMYLLDASVRRRLCKKVLEMGGNAVMSYYQSFDMEGDSGIVARAFGTCALIENKLNEPWKFSKSSTLNLNNVGTASENEHGGESDTAAIQKSKYILSEAADAAKRHKESMKDEVQLLTMKDFGRRVRVRMGGLVTARSVKYLGKLSSVLSDQETRDGWWQVSLLKSSPILALAEFCHLLIRN